MMAAHAVTIGSSLVTPFFVLDPVGSMTYRLAPNDIEHPGVADQKVICEAHANKCCPFTGGACQFVHVRHTALVLLREQARQFMQSLAPATATAVTTIPDPFPQLLPQAVSMNFSPPQPHLQAVAPATLSPSSSPSSPNASPNRGPSLADLEAVLSPNRVTVGNNSPFTSPLRSPKPMGKVPVVVGQHRIFCSGKGVPGASDEEIKALIHPYLVVDLFRPSGGREFCYISVEDEECLNNILALSKQDISSPMLSGMPVNLSRAKPMTVQVPTVFNNSTSNSRRHPPATPEYSRASSGLSPDAKEYYPASVKSGGESVESRHPALPAADDKEEVLPAKPEST